MGHYIVTGAGDQATLLRRVSSNNKMNIYRDMN